MSSQILARTLLSRSHRAILRPRGIIVVRCQGTVTAPAVAGSSKWQRPLGWVIAGSLVAVTTIGSSHLSFSDSATSMDALATLPLILGPAIEMDERLAENPKETSLIEEPETGITFPAVLESKHLFGVGVRKKYQVFNVYAIGLYANKNDFQGIHNNAEEQEAALLNPHKHRTLRIVMNRKVTMEVVISTLIESLEPRMHGKDLWALDEFSKLRNYGYLQKGDEIILTIRGGSIECKCGRRDGGRSVVRSEVFTRAVCDTYFGKDPISPAAKASIMAGISHL